ncbi:class I SAM-dependent methyltransferase [Rhodocytophaga aerolata]|uniref:Class I SAM-dependent methyltransferase n=1 Tax=Rhodocytophaga aerolata TaxID=455078 RepID=A0ABT8RAJ8_9BACT|nr:class I SAM-dependent methyltransferase [Rhodocytophaga aerolata]MDO1448228.1 class I SAM-dependent methyltransferase [Rhodocytophaga aerolata]
MCTLEMPTATQDFAGTLLHTYNQAALTLMISVGHQAGLFDQMGTMPPATSVEIAAATGLQERYVREWLGAMVTGEIIDYTPETGQYHLPASRAAFLMRSSGSDNLAVFAQYIPVLATVENDILNCFKNGGGVPYAKYSRFHEVMAEDSGQSVLSSLIDQILPLAPGLTASLEKGIEVMDVGCGSGRALNLLAKTFPKSRFTGYDLCLEPLEVARAEAHKAGLTNVTFQQRDLTHFAPDQPFDLITAFDAIHDQARPDQVLAMIYQSLKQDGTFLMQDIDGSSHLHNNLHHPLGTFLYTVSCMHCMTVSLAQDGMALGTMWGTEKAEQLLKEAGFKHMSVKRLPHDAQNCYYIVKKEITYPKVYGI